MVERLEQRGDAVVSYGRNVGLLPKGVNYAIFCQRARGDSEWRASVAFTHHALQGTRFVEEGDTAIVIVASVCVGLNDDRSPLDYQLGKAGALQLMRYYSTKRRSNAVSPWSFTGDKPFVTMAEVVSVIEFLASPLSSGVNGQNIVVDRGAQSGWR